MTPSKPALARLQHIAAALNVRKRTSISQLARELEVSGRTVQRDLDHMRDSLNLPIEADIAGHFFSGTVNLCHVCGRRKRSREEAS